MNILAFSDTHGFNTPLELGDIDICIFAGDYSAQSTLRETVSFLHYFDNLDVPNKILVPGNHDYFLNMGLSDNIFINRLSEISGLCVIGCAYTLEFMNWNFMKTELEMEEMIKKWPPCDMLITHSPPSHINGFPYSEFGSKSLTEYVQKYNPIHIFGHWHKNNQFGSSFNVSICNEKYQPQWKPTKIIM